MIQIAQIQSSANDIFGPLGENNMATGIAFVNGIHDKQAIVGNAVIVRRDIAIFASWW